MHTADIFREGHSKKLVSTSGFGTEVIGNLGKSPQQLIGIANQGGRTEHGANSDKSHGNAKNQSWAKANSTNEQGLLLGCDLYVETHLSPAAVAEIAQRGLMVWPRCESEVTDASLSQLRFHSTNKGELLTLQGELEKHELRVVMLNYLYDYSGIVGFSKMQGE